MKNNGRWMIIVMMLAGFIGTLSQNMLSSALPSIMADFGVSAAIAQWVTTSYILIMGIMSAVSAFLFNRFPTKPLIQISLAVFTAGCVVAWFANSFPMLLAARIIQAVGAGPLIPVLQISVLHIYPKEQQGYALGLTGIIVGFAPALGPTLSGILVDNFGWRGIFVFLIIVAAVALVCGQFVLKDLVGQRSLHLDMLSIILYSLGFTLIMLGITFMRSGSLLQPRVILGFMVGIVFLYIFVKRQAVLEQPFLNLMLLVNYKTLVFGSILLGMAYALNMAGTILVPLFNQTICPYSATVAGLLLLPGSLVIAICSPVSGKMADRLGAKKVCILGMISNIIGNLMFVFFGSGVGRIAIVTAYAFRGLGMALVMTPSTSLAVQDIELKDKAQAMAILNSFRQMSGSLISSVLVVAASTASLPSSSINIRGIHLAFVIMVVMSVSGVLLSALSPKSTVQEESKNE